MHTYDRVLVVKGDMVSRGPKISETGVSSSQTVVQIIATTNSIREDIHRVDVTSNHESR